MRLATLVCLLALLLQAPPSDGQEIIARDQARALLLQALKERGYPTTAETFELDDIEDPYFPKFFSFQSYANLPQRFVSTGVFAVNKRTADVWDTLLCRKVESRKIKPLQEKLRKQIKLSRKDYLAFSKEMPCRNN